ncbi:hypothetical protein [Streptomyces sp. NRRL F-5727]|uniref:hypothetical protein n=1 Tax=Streptomyces sp. NRRL F-5727 TaxID=1463871 RepID=UPI0004C86915|nr:hypothetical protein [Streptomyces sp. NRRL F-5727]
MGRFCFRRRRLVLLAWVVGVIAGVFAGFGYGAAPDNDFSGGDSQSAKAQQLTLMERHFPKERGDRLTLAIKAAKGIDDPAAKRRIERVVAALADSPVTGPVAPPYQDKSLVTKDRRIARTTTPLATKEVDRVTGAAGRFGRSLEPRGVTGAVGRRGSSLEPRGVTGAVGRFGHP